MSSDLWQARAKAFPAVALGAVLLFGAHHFYPAWFADKEIGIGFKPVTWQGWVVSIVAILTILLGLRTSRTSR